MSTDQLHAVRRDPRIQLLALLLGVGPVYAQAIYSSYLSLQHAFVSPTIESTLFNLTVLLGVFGNVLLFAHLVLCRDRLSSFNQRAGTLWRDIASGVALAAALFGLMLLFGLLLRAFGVEMMPEANQRIAEALAADPLLLAVWLGPVVWLQAGLFEELVRSFMLIRLWTVWPRHRLLMVLLSALPFGLAHLYQGWIGVAGTVLIGGLLGLHYLQRGRFLPLVIGHAIYDSGVLLVLVSAERQGLV